MGFQQGFRINTNTASLDTYRAYSKSQAGLEQNIERLSSGLRINSAKDDAAGLAISERMNNQVRGMQQANRNVQQGVNLLQTAEGGMNEIGNILGRMRELAVQSASDTVNSTDRISIDNEFNQLADEITRIASSTEYNGLTLLDGTYNETDDPAETLTIQIGSNNSDNDKLNLNFGDFRLSITTGYDQTDFGGTAPTDGLAASVYDVDMDAAETGNNGVKGFDLTTGANAQSTIDTLDAMIGSVNDARSDIGAKQNRLEFTSSNLMNSIQNNSASMSTIRDADFAAEAAELAKNQILTQSGTAMLAQANSLSQNVLSLIR